MPEIRLLPPHVADLIAAGEVVERPASAVKELIENAIDANAKNITVEIRSGGIPYLRVSDDGCGMSPSGAGTAFLRHATSKLRDANGLEAISSLGFRGEALAAIASVSRIELLTREMGAPSGTRVVLEAGDILEMGEAGCPEGTTIIARDLFYNTPARLKFLKSDRAESMACSAAALRMALARPDVSLRFIKDGAEEFMTPGDCRPLSCVYSLFGRDVASTFLEAGSTGDVSVEGFVSSPAHGRGNRAMQHFFVNARAVRSQKLQAALENAYKNSLLSGRYPSCVLYITLSPASVDVNVHPTKAEVKFSDERAVFDAVYGAVRSALEGETRPAEFPLSSTTQRVALSGAVQRMAEPSAPSEPRRETAYPPETGTARTYPPTSQPPRFDAVGDTLSVREPAGILYRAPEQIVITGASAPRDEASAAPPSQAGTEPQGIPPAADFKLVGEALGTYIIAERSGQGAAQGEMLLIDKHAAHERIIFDRLKSGGWHPMPQALISPVAVTPPDGGAELLIKNAGLLMKLGIEIEEFGENTVIIRAVPADTDAGQARAMLEEICTKLSGGGALEAASDEIFYTVACKAAIKAGGSSDPEENRALAARVLSGEVKYCPHGRPVAMTLTKRELDRHFGR